MWNIREYFQRHKEANWCVNRTTYQRVLNKDDNYIDKYIKYLWNIGLLKNVYPSTPFLRFG